MLVIFGKTVALTKMVETKVPIYNELMKSNIHTSGNCCHKCNGWIGYEGGYECQNKDCPCHEKKCCEKCKGKRHYGGALPYFPCPCHQNHKEERCIKCGTTRADFEGARGVKYQGVLCDLKLNDGRHSFQELSEECGCICSGKVKLPQIHLSECPFYQPPTPHQQWEERFDKQFIGLGTDERDFEGTIEKTAVKQFISSLLQEEREAAHDEGYAQGVQRDFCDKREGIREERARITKILENKKIKKPTLNFEFIHNEHLTDAITKIKEET